MTSKNSLLYLLPLLLLPALPAAQAAGAKATARPAPEAKARVKNRIVFQVSDADPKKWLMTLGNARNVQADLGEGNVELEIVVYGPAIGMLKNSSEVADRVEEAVATGVRVVACENTMTTLHLTRDDMLLGIDYVKAGVVELMRLQQAGWAYIRP
ncbi:MAG: hypothetical protein EG825_04760 [Rhodocyclaceae bacterium]|nr:hypothetical protein [Rhodocyclaceae bacterium]